MTNVPFKLLDLWVTVTQHHGPAEMNLRVLTSSSDFSSEDSNLFPCLHLSIL